MRLLIIAIAAAAMLVSGPAAAAAWEEHRFEDLGIAKGFPGEPTRSAGEYVTSVVGSAPTTDFYYEEDNIVFRNARGRTSGQSRYQRLYSGRVCRQCRR